MKKILVFLIISNCYSFKVNAQYRVDLKLASGLSDIWAIQTYDLFNTYVHYIPSLSYSGGLEFSYAINSKYGLSIESKYVQASAKQEAGNLIGPRFYISHLMNELGGYYYLREKIRVDLNLSHGIFLNTDYPISYEEAHKLGLSAGAYYHLNPTFTLGILLFTDITPYARYSNYSVGYSKKYDWLFYINGINLVVGIKLFDKANKE